MSKLISNQAQTVIDLFGGARRLCAALKGVGMERDPSCVYRWNYPKAKGGTGGLIPLKDFHFVLKAAEKQGIKLPRAVVSPFGTEAAKKESFFK